MRLALLLVVSALSVQAAGFSGTVRDPRGAAVADASVTLESAGTAVSSKTNPQGQFTFAGIAEGQYKLAIAHEGFELYTSTVSAGAAPLTITLRILSVRSSVDVTSGKSTLRNSDPNYKALRDNTLRTVYRVNNLVLTRDAGIFTFRAGSFSFLPPVLGHITGAVFLGDGNFHLTPATSISAGHLKRLSGAASVDENFSSLVVYFTDGTWREITAHAEQIDESPKLHQDELHRIQEALRHRDDAPKTYMRRLLDADDVPNMEADILAELYNNTPGSFRAFIHGRKHSDLRFTVDPRGVLPQLPAPEEVALFNLDFAVNNDGIWYLSHTLAEINAGIADSHEEKRIAAPDHYRIDTVIGSNLRLSAACELTLHPLIDAVRAIKLQLLPDLQVSRVAVDGHDVPFLQENRNRDGSFYLLPEQALIKGHTYNVTLEYEGGEIIHPTRGRVFFIDPTVAWYPKIGLISRATYDLTFRIPRGMSLVASGDLIQSGTDAGRAVSQWTSKIAIPSVGFNYGDFSQKERVDETTGFRINSTVSNSGKVFVNPDSSLGLNRSVNAVRVYSHWFGEPAFNHVAFSEGVVSASVPGLVFTNPIALSDSSARYSAFARYSGDRAAPNPSRAIFDELLSRQIARQWWGTLVDPISFHDEWLMRGLTDFSSSVYDMFAEADTNDFLEHWRDSHELLMTKTYLGTRRSEVAPLWLGSLSESLVTQRYTPLSDGMMPTFSAPNTFILGLKGGYVFQMLRRMMFDPVTGDKDFIAMMRDFTTTFANRSVSTEDFRAIADRHIKPQMDLGGNRSLDWFFHEWVYDTELPSYSLEYKIEKGEDGKPVMSGTLTQSDVSDRFMMPVPVYAKFGDKTHLMFTMDLRGNQTREFRARLPELPKKVLLNANYDILYNHVAVKELR